MLQARKNAWRALQKPYARSLHRTARRRAQDNDSSHSSAGSSSHGSSHGSSSHGDHATHSVPETETLGRSFYIILFGIIPGSFLLYNFQGSQTNPITKIMAKYADSRETWEQRNTLHTRMVEQAGQDRNLFLNAPERGLHDLTFPEVFNMGSPIAIPAGHGTNLDKLIAHFKEKAFKEEEEKLQRMKEGNIPGQKPWVEP